MGARVLVIEDNPANLELMSYLLGAYRYEVRQAMDGEAGLALARAERPAVVICDLQLPRMDGFAVVRALKADAATRSVPVIAVTAFAMVGDRDRVLKAGFDGYIGKPIVPETFVSQIEQFMGVSRTAAPQAAGEPGAAPSQPRAAAAGARILAVDNTAANRDLMEGLLRGVGYSVRSATNVREALQVFRNWAPDLVISDINMPGENGLDLLRQVRADPERGRVPFLIASATAWTPEMQRGALALGADAFLLEPAEPHAILAEVAALLARHPPRAP